ncbi:hypothetical protein BDN72DRAFT_814413 [Pluteus cervinus]|uniref:Uncharacterized protein n=1 Tax=Pluteus cervinus TaxID=181527 RepID=A0ACD3B591_9AGAR|nr:hypothetical protein BDN72DRAFT_814413 [Pluteus cervinus]
MLHAFLEFLKLLGTVRRWFWAQLRKTKPQQLSSIFSSIIRYLLRRLGLRRNVKRCGAPSRKAIEDKPSTTNHRVTVVNNRKTTGVVEISLDGGEPVMIMPSYAPQPRNTMINIDIEAQNSSTDTFEHQFTTEPAEGLMPYSTGLASVSASLQHLNVDSVQGNAMGYGSRPASVAPSEVQNPRINTPGLAIEPKLEYRGPALNNDRIKPCAPELYQRYDRNIIVPRKSQNITITPGTRTFATYSDPKGWTSYIHPEGALYFFHEDKRVFTDAWLFNSRVLEQVHQDMDTIFGFMEKNHIDRHSGVDLVLDMIPDKNSANIDCFYYLADHQNRTIFFLDNLDAEEIPAWHTITGVTTRSHLRHEIESQYWYHNILFPRALFVHHEIVDELRDLILHAIGDVMTSATSTSPYGLGELQNMLSLANSLRKNVGTQYGGSACLIGRLMYIFVRQRFNNFHGEQGARLDRDQSVHGTVRGRRTWLVKCFSPLLFSAPDVHLRGLEKMWVDGLMHHSAWTHFIKKLIDEWQEFILFATVLLNANVAFLAIQSVDTHADPTVRSPAQIASYLSIIASIGSIILGLLLARQNRTKSRETVDDVLTYLQNKKHPILGLETLAIMYSLPYALLMWAMVAFLLAFALLWFTNTSLATRVSVGVAVLAVSFLIAWCIWMAWEKTQRPTEEDGVAAEPDQIEEKLRQDAELRRKGSDASSRRSRTKGFRMPTLNSLSFGPRRSTTGETLVAESV